MYTISIGDSKMMLKYLNYTDYFWYNKREDNQKIKLIKNHKVFNSK